MCQPRPPSVSIGETNTDVNAPTKRLWWFDKWKKKTKTTKGRNYKHLGNCLPVVLHCMLAFCRVFQNIWRRYWIKTSLTSFHWQKTHVLVVPKLYQEKGEVGLTTSCSCMSLRAVLLVNQFDVVCSRFLLLLLLHSNSSSWMSEKLHISVCK